MKKLSNIILLIIAFALVSFAQTKVLTNADVIEMSKAGLPEGIILTKIQSSETQFDTDIPALKLLTGAGLSQNVITAMIEKQSSATNQIKADNKNYQPQTEYGQISEIYGMTRVYLDTDNFQARENIVKIIEKDSNLRVVSTPGEAEFAIVFRAVAEATGASITGTQVVQNSNVRGEMAVAVKGKTDPRNVRIVWSKQKIQEWNNGITWNTDPATSTIKSFLKELNKK